MQYKTKNWGFLVNFCFTIQDWRNDFRPFIVTLQLLFLSFKWTTHHVFFFFFGKWLLPLLFCPTNPLNTYGSLSCNAPSCLFNRTTVQVPMLHWQGDAVKMLLALDMLPPLPTMPWSHTHCYTYRNFEFLAEYIKNAYIYNTFWCFVCVKNLWCLKIWGHSSKLLLFLCKIVHFFTSKYIYGTHNRDQLYIKALIFELVDSKMLNMLVRVSAASHDFSPSMLTSQ